MSVREQTVEDSFSPGQRLGKYELLATIGRPSIAAAPTSSPAPPTTPAFDIDELYKKAISHHLAGHFAAAAAAFTDLLAIDPTYAGAQRGRGMAYQRMGYIAKALDSYRAYLTLRPAASDAAAIRGRIAELEAQ